MSYLKRILLIICLFAISFNTYAQKGIIKMISEHNLEKIKSKVEAGKIDINEPVEKNYAIIKAIRYQDLEIVKYLLEKGADLNIKGGTDMCLHQAVIWGNPEVVKLLIEHGANINARDYRNYTALQQLAEEGVQDYQKLILNLIGETYGKIDKFLDKSTVIDKKMFYDNDSLNFMQILESACPIAKVLIDNGIDIETELKRMSALQMAINSKNILLTMYLVERGADVNFTGDPQYYPTPVYYAVKKDMPRMVSYLISKGAKDMPFTYAVENFETYYGENSMLKYDYLDLINFLIENGAKDLNADLYKTAFRCYYDTYGFNNRNQMLNLVMTSLKTMPDSIHNKNGAHPLFDLVHYMSSDPDLDSAICVKIKDVIKLGYSPSKIYQGYDRIYKVGAEVLFDSTEEHNWEKEYLAKKVDDYGMWFVTPLEYAIYKGKIKAVKVFIEAGYDNSPDLVNRAIHIAKYCANQYNSDEERQNIYNLIKNKFKV